MSSGGWKTVGSAWFVNLRSNFPICKPLKKSCRQVFADRGVVVVQDLQRLISLECVKSPRRGLYQDVIFGFSASSTLALLLLKSNQSSDGEFWAFKMLFLDSSFSTSFFFYACFAFSGKFRQLVFQLHYSSKYQILPRQTVVNI